MLEFDDAPKGLARLIYASRASSDSGPGGLSELMRNILLRSIHNNRMAAVTGFLVAGEGRFLQLLEGPIAEVEVTFDRIRRDPRHKNLVVIDRGAAERRLFRDWNMGQHQVGVADREVLAQVGLTAFTPESLNGESALKLLSMLGGRYLQ